MGLEAYLFRIKLIKPIKGNEIIKYFECSGMNYLKGKTEKNNQYKNYYFEKRTKDGLTECHCLSANDILENFSMRFSVLSPPSIIKQTFEIFNKLNKLRKIEITDTEIINQIYLELRKRGKIDKNFDGIKGTELENEIRQRSIIPLNMNNFLANEYNIRKRQLIFSNINGKIIESGDVSLTEMENSGTVHHYFDWIEDYF